MILRGLTFLSEEFNLEKGMPFEGKLLPQLITVNEAKNC